MNTSESSDTSETTKAQQSKPTTIILTLVPVRPNAEPYLAIRELCKRLGRVYGVKVTSIAPAAVPDEKESDREQ